MKKVTKLAWLALLGFAALGMERRMTAAGTPPRRPKSLLQKYNALRRRFQPST